MPPVRTAFFWHLSVLLRLGSLIFAGLIGNAAAGLAGGLAGGLALAATAVLGALAEIPRVQCLDSLHNFVSPFLWVFFR